MNENNHMVLKRKLDSVNRWANQNKNTLKMASWKDLKKCYLTLKTFINTEAAVLRCSVKKVFL